jgi:mannose-6-phosphate isomerase-like protein (cupin superfamily)
VIKSTIESCLKMELPRIENRTGSITPVHSNLEIPFDIKRVFYIYDIPGGKSRGAHAHKKCHQFLVAASGAFEVHLDDGNDQTSILLNRPNMGLHIPPGIWASEQNFSSSAICLVLASRDFEENDYIRDYKEYLKYVQNPSTC